MSSSSDIFVIIIIIITVGFYFAVDKTSYYNTTVPASICQYNPKVSRRHLVCTCRLTNVKYAGTEIASEYHTLHCLAPVLHSLLPSNRELMKVLHSLNVEISHFTRKLLDRLLRSRTIHLS